jgi:hypothetical protein
MRCCIVGCTIARVPDILVQRGQPALSTASKKIRNFPHPPLWTPRKAELNNAPTKRTARVIDCETDEARRVSHTVARNTKHSHLVHKLRFEYQLLFKPLNSAKKRSITFCSHESWNVYRPPHKAGRKGRDFHSHKQRWRIKTGQCWRRYLLLVLESQVQLRLRSRDFWWTKWHRSKVSCKCFHFCPDNYEYPSRFLWLCRLRRGSAVAWLLGSQVRMPLRALMFVSCVCCVWCR